MWQHDNAQPHTAADTKMFFERRNVEMLHQSPYSPDLNQCDRWLFKELKRQLKGTISISVDDVKKLALQAFRQIPQERFQQEIERLLKHCLAVISSGGSYVTR